MIVAYDIASSLLYVEAWEGHAASATHGDDAGSLIKSLMNLPSLDIVMSQ